MKNPKVTLIVPIYNTFQFLDRCLTSIKDQTLKDIEVILVIDGSPDDSESFCKEFIKGDNRFVLKIKKNGGLASARNYGMQFATGEYICYIDSDDYISLDYCEVLYNTAKEHAVDVVIFGLTYIKNNTESERFSMFEKNKKLAKKDILEYLKNTTSNKILWYVNKFFRRSFLLENDILFDEEILFGDDSIFNLKCFYNADSLYSIDKSLYYYVYNPNSITQKKYKHNLLANIEVQFDKRLNFHAQNNEINNKVYLEDISRNYIEHTLFIIFSNIRHSKNINRISELKNSRNSKIYKLGFEYYKPSERITLKMKLMVYLFKKKYYFLLDKLI